MKSLSIEVAHVYKDFGVEQMLGLEELNLVLTKCPLNFKVCVLIDDYHNDFEAEQLTKIHNKLSLVGEVFLEKNFESKALLLLEKLPQDRVDQLVYLKGTKILLKKGSRVTCPILTAAWYLYRLETSEELLNILPKKFKKNEDKVKEIMKELNVNEKSITYRFF